MKKLLLLSLMISTLFFFNSCDDSFDEPKVAYEARSEFLPGKGLGDNNNIGILMIHGFTRSTQSIRDVAYALNEKGYTISMPCLAGHGTTPEDLEETTTQDWVNSVKDAYNELKPKVGKLYILGLSMGGSLALHSAINYEIDGVITINAFANDIGLFGHVFYEPSTPRFIPLGNTSDIKKEGVAEWGYDRAPKKSIANMLELSSIITKDISKIECPILIFKSYEDNMVPNENQEFINNNVSSENKKLIVLENSYHVATLDNDQQIIIDETDNFIQETIQNK